MHSTAAPLSAAGRTSEPPEAAFVIRVTAGPEEGASVRIDGVEPTRLLVGQSSVCDQLFACAPIPPRGSRLSTAEPSVYATFPFTGGGPSGMSPTTQATGLSHAVKAYAAQSATTPLASSTVPRRSPLPDDIEITIQYC